MPELPEMENYKRLLHPRLTGKTITGVEVTREKTVNTEARFFVEHVTGKRVVGVQRRAKHLLFQLDGHEVLLLHLMLGGWMYWGTEENKPDHTVQVTLAFGRERLYFLGLRLGYLHLLSELKAEEKLRELGPEPLAPHFTERDWQHLRDGKRGMLKSTLPDQHFLSGIGNCYADEICFAAGLLPSRKMQELSDEESHRLFRAVKEVLTEASAKGGYMQPLYKGDTQTGGFDPLCRVYDREGETCVRCGNRVERQELASRKAFFCRGCQH